MEALLLKAARAGVRFEAKGDDLRVTAPKGAMTDELKNEISSYKVQILDYIRTGLTNFDVPKELKIDPANRLEPFPLTEIQHAYWLGRDASLEMGNIATHLYVELDCPNLDTGRLTRALQQMIDRHDMLRAIVDHDGTQRILPKVPAYEIAVSDQTEASISEAQAAIMANRDALSHQVLKADQWPLFEVRVTRLPVARLRLHVSLDLLILDAWSIFLFFREWHQLYSNPKLHLEPLGLSFRDYVLSEKESHDTAAYNKAQAYWSNRLDSIPPAPDLPLRPDVALRGKPHFSRREGRVPKARWDRLKASARSKGLTPSGLMLAAYSEVLARWSGGPHFTINVTLSNRIPVHRDINSIFGDFTSLIMQEVDRRDSRQSFLEFALQLQRQFLTDLDHRQFGGVTMLREWAKRRGGSFQAAMPVVFSSGLIWSGDESVGDIEQFGEKVFSVSQTSQVWLDHHVMEVKGDLVLIWDAADGVFPDGMLDSMFASYRDVIDRLAEDSSAVWASKNIVCLPPEMARRREITSQTVQPPIKRLLHSGFVTNAARDPDAAAVISPDRTLTYGELLSESCALATSLIQYGLNAGEPVAIFMHKGWEQIVAVYGILLAGGAYMPIDAALPIKRQIELMRIGEVKQVVMQPGMMREEFTQIPLNFVEVRAGAKGEFGLQHAASLEQSLDELAYVIFTSGTTGIPKGVMIDHRGAINTTEYINRLYRVLPDDRVLAVSSLSFDLSVYDIFGLLDAGGALVIPDYKKGHDPVHWRELIARHKVTLWNSAPQLMQMLMDSYQNEKREESVLRTVLLSGDFIPLNLPDRIRNRHPGVSVTSLGGATEASIWSVYYPITTVDASWSSIPYGKALPNQTMYVLDAALRPCPDFVTGRIYIGGIGLAMGYWRDPEKTDQRFIVHPTTGERLYDTGDLGRYAPDGNIIIIGRDDGQIKLRGHRIELGEIEAVLRQYSGVERAIVLPCGTSEIRQLVAYLIGSGGIQFEPKSIQQYIEERLPEYMVPSHVVQLDSIPLLANGKVDYKALPVVTEVDAEERTDMVMPRNKIEQVIHGVWTRLIVGYDKISVTDSFFDLGGDSLLATHLLRELNNALPFGLEMHELFENITIESLAILFEKKTIGDQFAATNSAAKERDRIFADIAAAKAYFDTLDFNAKPNSAGLSAPQAIFVTGGTGWLGTHVIAELLRATDAKLYCLVRAKDKTEGFARLLRGFSQCGIEIDDKWPQRLEPLCGDLCLPDLGLDRNEWEKNSKSVDLIYHVGASVNVTHDYSTHRNTNVLPINSIVRLATEHRLKPVLFSSPMTVCRRHLEGKLVVLGSEKPYPDPEGLPTGYAQSKWVAEQILLAAAERGLPVKIYRSSHALPSTQTGKAKPRDTYGSVLKIACEVGLVPNWENSALYGVPVDKLSHLMVENSLLNDGYRGLIHIENRTPQSLTAIMRHLLEGDEKATTVPLDAWEKECLQAADCLSIEDAMLVKTLFTHQPIGIPVEHMFSYHPFATSYFETLGQAGKLEGLTPAEYWRSVYGVFGKTNLVIAAT